MRAFIGLILRHRHCAGERASPRGATRRVRQFPLRAPVWVGRPGIVFARARPRSYSARAPSGPRLKAGMPRHVKPAVVDCRPDEDRSLPRAASARFARHRKIMESPSRRRVRASGKGVPGSIPNREDAESVTTPAWATQGPSEAGVSLFADCGARPDRPGAGPSHRNPAARSIRRFARPIAIRRQVRPARTLPALRGGACDRAGRSGSPERPGKAACDRAPPGSNPIPPPGPRIAGGILSASLAFLRQNRRWLAAGFLLLFVSAFGQSFFVALSGGEIRRAFDLSNGDFGLIYMGARWPARWRSALSARSWTAGRPAGRPSSPSWRWRSARCSWPWHPAHWSSLSPCSSCACSDRALLRPRRLSLLGPLVRAGPGGGARAGRLARLARAERRPGGAAAALRPGAGAARLARHLGHCRGAARHRRPALAAVLFRRERQPAEAPGADTAAAGWTRREALRDPLFPLLLMAMLPPAFISNNDPLPPGVSRRAARLDARPLRLALPLYALTTLTSLLVAGWCVDRARRRPSCRSTSCRSASAASCSARWKATRRHPLPRPLRPQRRFSLTLFGTLWPEVYGREASGRDPLGHRAPHGARRRPGAGSRRRPDRPGRLLSALPDAARPLPASPSRRS